MLASWSPDDPDDTCIEYWSGPWRFLYNPCTDGETYFALLGPLDDERGRRVPIDREFWREKFPAAGRFIDRLVEDGRWDRLINIRCRKWSVGRLAIIGDAAHAMPPNLGQAANMAFTNAMALAAIVDAENDVPTALVDWEKRQRPLTDHVQWWSYIYDAVLLRWPLGLTSLRSDVLRMVSKTEWFEDGLNRGARHVPMGYRDFMDAQPRIGTS
jgi:2-polyprenyl-6-methoxyphenol hydroxylase-like FAD-dependent oxidoreductase